MQKEDIAIQRLMYHAEKISSEDYKNVANQRIEEADCEIDIKVIDELVEDVNMKKVRIRSLINDKKIYEIFVYKTKT